MAYLDLARSHAPLLMITLPLLGAALAFVAPWMRAAWIACMFAALAAGALAFDFGARAFTGAVSAPQESAALAMDGAGIFTAPLVLCLLALSAISGGVLLKDLPPRIGALACALLMCVGAGWVGALAARDLVGVLLSVECAWLASVVLLALSPERGALNGALRMLATGAVSSALFLIGLGFLSRGAGGLDIAALASASLASPSLAAIGVGLILFSIAAKAGAAPLHVWTPAAYGRAGRFAALAIGVVGAVGALSALVRIAVHTVIMPDIGAAVSALLATLGAASVVIGSVQAAGARHPLRLVAYAAAAQGGIVLLSVGLGSPAGLAAAFVQLVAFAASATALLGGAIAGNVRRMAQIDGLGRRAPIAGVAITAGALSLMGAPLTLGFLGRWRLIEAGVGAEWWWAAGVVIFASLAGVFYGGRLIERLYFRRAAAAFAGDIGIWRVTLAPALVAATLATAIGLAPAVLLNAANLAAALMFRGGA